MLKMGVGDTVIGKKNGNQNEDRRMSECGSAQLSDSSEVKVRGKQFLYGMEQLFIYVYFLYVHQL